MTTPTTNARIKLESSFEEDELFLLSLGVEVPVSLSSLLVLSVEVVVLFELLSELSSSELLLINFWISAVSTSFKK